MAAVHDRADSAVNLDADSSLSVNYESAADISFAEHLEPNALNVNDIADAALGDNLRAGVQHEQLKQPGPLQGKTINIGEPDLVEADDIDLSKKTLEEDDLSKPLEGDTVKDASEVVSDEIIVGTTQSSGNSAVDPDDTDEEKRTKNEEEWMDILGNGLLTKKIIWPGTEQRPQHAEQVVIKCRGLLEDGTEVDCNDSLQLMVGDGDVVQAVDMCVALMGLGEECVLVTDAKYAYGHKGREPDIPPDAKITYNLKLIQIEPAADLRLLSAMQRVQMAEVKRARGNWWYTREDYTNAMGSYSKALAILDGPSSYPEKELPEDLQKLIDCRVVCYNNMAATQLKVGANEQALHCCDKVLRIQKDNVKALFRKGKCLAAMGDTKEAIDYLRQAQYLEPETKIIQAELSRLNQRYHKEVSSERAMYARMMGEHRTNINKKSRSFPSWLLFGGVGGACTAVVIALATYRYMHS